MPTITTASCETARNASQDSLVHLLLNVEGIQENIIDNQELNVIILDTLTNLNIESELLSEMRQKVIETITTANIEDLPVLVKFVLQDLNSSEASQIIRDLREKLDFNSTFNPLISSTPLESKSKEISKGIEGCVLNTIKHALKFQNLYVMLGSSN
ncbi:fanconi anemia group D2 protein [Caerostris extrusa]|uniref:Fanconi anemia group D2 protein n=1 Tax=Caerostris extrusa TaxID=172846 RepID=A0AAV4QGK4_CAEEX|nr:fanconi anemia group D2 protein [Caerostris extrusa]